MIKEEKGFTLVELLWVISLIVILLVSTYYIFEGGLTLNQVVGDQSKVQTEARASLERMAKYLRGATLWGAGDYEITFRCDVDDDLMGEDTTFTLSGTRLILKIEEMNDVPMRDITLATYVRNREQGVPIFTYYGESTGTLGPQLIENPEEEYSNVRMIHIKLIVDVDPTRKPGPYTVETDVKLRNFEI